MWYQVDKTEQGKQNFACSKLPSLYRRTKTARRFPPAATTLRLNTGEHHKTLSQIQLANDFNSVSGKALFMKS
ncbi:hypothetical protein L1987_79280 [Smallanthus sonchifolius]|uniref:Uncharacterized protein n=1 Tax=Smallanthus sonchifolius TaxID=185202 RepID=A0ACB8ZF83_9ASTR|nr:hypothetical protein L1987_79280 [Smallanthus sonchifolius]